MVRHIESIQSAVNLAGRLEAVADYDGGSTLYREAWLASRSILGDYKPITFECANAAALSLEKAGNGERAIEITNGCGDRASKNLADRTKKAS